MTKRDLVDAVAQRHGYLSRRQVETAVNFVFRAMGSALQEQGRIEIRGFGSFALKSRRSREGRNPRTGAAVAVAAKRVPFFRAGKRLRLEVAAGPPRRGT